MHGACYLLYFITIKYCMSTCSRPHMCTFLCMLMHGSPSVQLFEQGLRDFTWRTEESADFIENASALVCVHLHRNLDIVQTNCAEIMNITLSWSLAPLDVFAAREPHTPLVIEDMVAQQMYVACVSVCGAG